MSVAIWDFVRTVSSKYENYQFLTEEDTQKIDTITSDPAYYIYSHSCNYFLEMMQDEFLWALSLVVKKQKYSYLRNMEIYSRTTDIPDALAEECEEYYSSWEQSSRETVDMSMQHALGIIWHATEYSESDSDTI